MPISNDIERKYLDLWLCTEIRDLARMDTHIFSSMFFFMFYSRHLKTPGIHKISNFKKKKKIVYDDNTFSTSKRIGKVKNLTSFYGKPLTSND